MLIVDESGVGTCAATPRTREYPRSVRRGDPALSVMNDFTTQAAPFVREQCGIAAGLDALFRFGTRALLVVRDIQVMGIVTVEQLHGEPRASSMAAGAPLCVAELMTEERDFPSIDWQTVLDSTVNDLLEIFEGAECKYLVVVEKLGETLARVRGLIDRSHLPRRLLDRFVTV
jgi:hypothetical protein